ncbi:amidohydrolase [Acidisphaera sp. L21]|uniref:amidohydrolase family protein n=1 Tax=Acidisphaera sp. L21 TaxID=1641851 RepID=UPI00131E8499|nr:amidohydrolase family protein [Acidisphaera sp. L21]
MGTSTTADPNYLPVRPDWLAREAEAVLEADLPIIDAHHHLWDRPGWRYMAEELLADANSGHRIVATLFMQAQTMYRATGPVSLRDIGETEFVNGVAAMGASGHYGPTLLCAGIIGRADLRLGAAVRPVLEAHIRAGNGRFRGIRHTVAWDADTSLLNPRSVAPPGLLSDASYRAGFAELAPLGLSFDAWLFHPQLDELTALARLFPDTQIILNHCGGPLGINAYRDTTVLAAWSRSIRTLSACPNVCVKLGGLGMRISGFDFEKQPDPPSSQQLAAAWRPFIETCIEAFGPARCMFESNFPVDKGSYSYRACWNAFKRLAAGASVDEKTALFSGTAQAIYRVELP